MSSSNNLSIDGDLVRTLANLLEETGLSEIEYAIGEHRIRVARTIATQVLAAAGPAQAPAAEIAKPPVVAPVDHPGAIKSPMVGTAYIAPQPDQPPFVKLGDKVEEGHVLLIIEAMKVMNQIRAAQAGRIAEILIADGAPVEYGQVLMVIE